MVNYIDERGRLHYASVAALMNRQRRVDGIISVYIPISGGASRMRYRANQQYKIQAGRGITGNGLFRVTAISLQTLDQITEADALAEGGYTIAEYRALWLKLNGAWDDNLPVYVLQITPMGEAP
jgi:hypothetical protein